MESVSNQLGTKIRQYRNRLGVTQEALALNSGINVSFLGDIERGLKKPSIESLEKLLRVLGVTFQEFFNFETTIKPFKSCTAVEKLNLKLQDRSENEIEMIYNVIQQILEFTDNKRSKT
jgi:transcriptional regulator with XRE-family HTH domain